ncbi:nuclear receptor subfamily 0 group B member 2-like [Lampris incognitus]|uniref:nuclear receptor subfamily 0 group B member 2-like n=1 Tax=Lampris incognitus TaxID=2546036 RepID=UPI0024B633A2|nr:nuclear receptor subfamily 0 group B member 2-like [Lampris incognitus]
MFPSQEKMSSCACPGHRRQHPHTILCNILSWRDTSHLHNKLNHTITGHSCVCEQGRTVCLKNPDATCPVASSVLVKTVLFMRGLPSFTQLPARDQFLLLGDSWAPLFLLGLAQERVVFEVADVPHSSMLRQILLGQRQSDKEADGTGLPPTHNTVHKLQTRLRRLWNLDLSPKEYAYLRGVMLFNPDVEGLTASFFVEGLHREAQRALQEVIQLLHPKDTGRLGCILSAASSIQTVSQNLVLELFFRPVVGNASLLALLSEMLFIQQDYR